MTTKALSLMCSPDTQLLLETARQKGDWCTYLCFIVMWASTILRVSLSRCLAKMVVLSKLGMHPHMRLCAARCANGMFLIDRLCSLSWTFTQCPVCPRYTSSHDKGRLKTTSFTHGLNSDACFTPQPSWGAYLCASVFHCTVGQILLSRSGVTKTTLTANRDNTFCF